MNKEEARDRERMKEGKQNKTSKGKQQNRVKFVSMSIQVPRGEEGRGSGKLHVADALPAMKKPPVPFVYWFQFGPRAEMSALEN